MWLGSRPPRPISAGCNGVRCIGAALCRCGSRSIDFAIALDVVQHLPLWLAATRQALAELRARVRPGGHLFVRTNAQSFPAGGRRRGRELFTILQPAELRASLNCRLCGRPPERPERAAWLAEIPRSSGPGAAPSPRNTTDCSQNRRSQRSRTSILQTRLASARRPPRVHRVAIASEEPSSPYVALSACPVTFSRPRSRIRAVP